MGKPVRKAFCLYLCVKLNMMKNNQDNTQPSNIWGQKFPLFGLIVISIFVLLVVGRAWYMGIPLAEIFKNQDNPPPKTESSLSQ
jgi:hypothetical protein